MELAPSPGCAKDRPRLTSFRPAGACMNNRPGARSKSLDSNAPWQNTKCMSSGGTSERLHVKPLMTKVYEHESIVHTTNRGLRFPVNSMEIRERQSTIGDGPPGKLSFSGMRSLRVKDGGLTSLSRWNHLYHLAQGEVKGNPSQLRAGPAFAACESEGATGFSEVFATLRVAMKIPPSMAACSVPRDKGSEIIWTTALFSKSALTSPHVASLS